MKDDTQVSVQGEGSVLEFSPPSPQRGSGCLAEDQQAHL